MLVGDEAYFSQYLFDQQFGHRGWSGMVATIEANPSVLLDEKKITVAELIILELLLEIDAMDDALGTAWQPIAHASDLSPVDLFAKQPYSELADVLKIWQDAFEWSYYDEVLAGIQISSQRQAQTPTPKIAHSFQAMFCIDERECSIRRHVEQVDAQCETFGTPGFFSVEFFFSPQNAQFYEKLCPAPVTPNYLIKEYNVTRPRPHDVFYTSKTHLALTGYLSAFTFGFWAIVKLVKDLFKPKMAPAISNAFAVMQPNSKLTIENNSLSDTARQWLANWLCGRRNGHPCTRGLAK
ncbi:MAG: putative inorganic carbon transporter subunit DabA [Methylotenera sp.]